MLMGRKCAPFFIKTLMDNREYRRAYSRFRGAIYPKILAEIGSCP